MWTVAHGQILTLDNLMLHGHTLANCCCKCCCNEEFVDHLLISCLVAHSLWMYIGLIGSCQVQLQTYFFVGIIGLGNIILIFGIWFWDI